MMNLIELTKDKSKKSVKDIEDNTKTKFKTMKIALVF